MNTKPTDKELLDVIEGLNIHINCDIGHPGGFAETAEPPCEREADFSVNFHACPPLIEHYGPRAGTGAGTWCSYHLAIYTANTQTLIRLTQGRGGCRFCGHHFREIQDCVWNVTPIR